MATRVLQSLLQSATMLGSTPPPLSSSPASAAGQQPGILATAGLVVGSTYGPTQANSTPGQHELVLLQCMILSFQFLYGKGMRWDTMGMLYWQAPQLYGNAGVSLLASQKQRDPHYGRSKNA